MPSKQQPIDKRYQPCPEERRRKISAAKKGRPNGLIGHHHSEETKEKLRSIMVRKQCLIAGWNKGIPFSEESRNKMSEAAKSRPRTPCSEETKARISIANRGKKLSAEHRAKLSAAKIDYVPWMKGRHHSPETKKKLSEASTGRIPTNKGIPLTEEQKNKLSISLKGRKSPMEGKHHSEETKKKISTNNFHKGRFGELSTQWKGGVTPLHQKIRMAPEIIKWKRDILARDHFQCQKCKKGEGALNAHHILGFAEYPELRADMNNGITLHQDCHLKFHSIYGKHGNNIDQIRGYLHG